MIDWSIQGRDLLVPARAGGIVAEGGFLFQRSYAAWLLSGLLANSDGVVALRYEGAQDVDLMLADGSEIYVQVKNYEKTELDWGAVRTIVSRFADDLRAARAGAGVERASRLSFRIVAAAAVSHADVLNLLRRVYVDNNARRLARELNEISANVTAEEDVRRVLAGLVTELFPASIPTDVFRLMAEARLARFGIPVDEIDGAVRTILDRMSWRATVCAADVLDWIADHLPPEHPSSRYGSIAPFSTRARPNVGVPRLFYTSQSDIWVGIANGLDVARDLAPEVRAALLAGGAAKLLVHGPSGAGKSTLARRVIWDLQQAGVLVAFELRGPDPSDAEWGALLRLAARLRSEGDLRAALVVDDIHDNPLLAERVSQLDPDTGLVVVATAWTREVGGLSLGNGVLEFGLGAISDVEAEAAADRVGRGMNAIPPAELANVLASGQFVVLNIALLEGGDLAGFGRRLLGRIDAGAPEMVDAYVDLCICGVDDRSVPVGLMDRVHGNVADLLSNPIMGGLVFPVGTDRLRCGHRVLAEAVVSASAKQRASRILSLVGAVDAASGHERRFGIGLIEDLVRSPAFSAGLTPLVGRACRSLASHGQYLDIRRCARILTSIGQADDAESVEALATFDRVETGPDAAAFRSDVGRRDPEVAFDLLLGFYRGNPTGWGWRNFLHMAKELDPGRRAEALSLAADRLAQTDVGTAKVLIDLMNSGGGRLERDRSLAASLLLRFDGSVSLARATAQLITDNLRSAGLFAALLDYATPLVAATGDGLMLARSLAAAAKHADLADRRRLLYTLLNIANAAASVHVRGTLLKACATLAGPDDVVNVEAALGPAGSGELNRLTAARHILRRIGQGAEALPGG